MNKLNTRKLASIRALFDLNMSDMAKIIDATSVTYSRKENGENEFKLLEAKAIADYIDELDESKKWYIEDIFF